MTRLIRLLTFASVPPLLVAFALVGATGVLLGVAVSLPLVGALLAGTWLVYLGERLARAPEDAVNHPARTRWVQEHRTILVGLAALCAVVGGGMVPLLRRATVVGGGVVALAGAAYALPLIRGRRLKTLPVVKPLLVGLAWAAATVVLPIVEGGHSVGLAASVLAFVRALTVGVNVLLHDWAERQGDAAAGAATLPMAWSWPRLQRAVRGLVVLALLAEGVLWYLAGALVAVDAVGLLLLLARTRRAPAGGWRESLVLDLYVAWPLVTGLVGWGIAR